MENINLEKIKPLLAENDISFAGVFGSYARGEEKAGSDIDLLVRFSKVPGLFKFVHIQNELSDALGIPVDLVTENALSPYMKEAVLGDLKTIYGQR